MSEPFLAEVKMVGFDFAPKGWAFCDGQEMPIQQNPSLYALLGTQYGGNGTTTFALPDLRGRVPVHPSPGYNVGHKGGLENVVLSQSQMAAHTHEVSGTDAPANKGSVGPNRDRCYATVLETEPQDVIYGDAVSLTSMSPKVVSFCDGQSQPHTNVQPLQTLNFCIALDGLFPPRT